MQFNSVYYLHIPKTGGRWMIDGVNQHVKKILTLYNLNFLNDSDKYHNLNNTHFGWIPEIDSQTFVYTAIREPSAQMCSLFAHRFMTNADKLKNNKIEKIKEVMFDHINTYKDQYSNNQSKHICYNYDNEIEDYGDRKSTRLNSSHIPLSRMPSSA